MPQRDEEIAGKDLKTKATQPIGHKAKLTDYHDQGDSQNEDDNTKKTDLNIEKEKVDAIDNKGIVCEYKPEDIKEIKQQQRKKLRKKNPEDKQR